MNKNKGFTLIELLVVVVVIGILAGMVFVTIGDIQVDARNARRRSDMRAIWSAMEMYRIEVRGGRGYHEITVGGTPARVTTVGISPYLDPLPKDPDNTAYYGFHSTSGAAHFCIWAELEGGGVVTASEKGVRDMPSAPTTLEICP